MTTWTIVRDTLTDRYWGYRLPAPSISTRRELFQGSPYQCWAGSSEHGILGVWSLYDSRRRDSRGWAETRCSELSDEEPALTGDVPVNWVVLDPTSDDPDDVRHGFAWFPTSGAQCFELRFAAPKRSLGRDGFVHAFQQLMASFGLLYPVPIGFIWTFDPWSEENPDPFDPYHLLALGGSLLHQNREYRTALECYLACLLLDRVGPDDLPDGVHRVIAQSGVSDPTDVEEVLLALPVEPGGKLDGPALWTVWEGVGLSFAFSGALEASAQVFRRAADFALELLPGEAWAREAAGNSLYDLANSHFALGDPGSAGRALTEAAALHSDPARAMAALLEKVRRDPAFEAFLDTGAGRALLG